ncbi:cbb3-type cytochrome c oxidase N-terminal domain-containing protein [Bdellovibrio reynosensis]|uniref:C-type cytochrome n=1 Tax=Bdellovibrio reynosensis TaxID=2835041 RepID=A0ABY4C9A2_9BACT|nr:cbb3-type cytochrome c oxidase N-terminal domain-containing protein [Bdellovibrio reynosensis]UOF01568.1 c-type cytochrome [Bdellovibrio reynosensis]
MSDEKFHEYDGIIEHDNPLPTWWLWTFLLTIIFAFMYFLHYEIAGGPTLKDELKVAMAEIDKAQATAQSNVPVETEESLKAMFGKDEVLATGAEQYTAKCAACHGQELQGLVGPNLTDKFWLHGGTRMEVVKVITDGIPEKGMPPWGPVLKKPELYALAAYIFSKQGSNPAGAKAPQGQEIEGH